MVHEEETQPHVSIGLPLFNAQPYLTSTLNCLLEQTFKDFELIISDNASTDQTESICRDYAQRDGRIRYVRNATNLGAAANFNSVVQLARGKYFKWSAHDDLHRPEFLRRCVEVLEAQPDVVLCYSQHAVIDETGKEIRKGNRPLGTAEERPSERFRNVMMHQLGAPMIWGLMRTDVLRTTPIIATYYASDLVLLAELAMCGRFHEVPEELFLHREHNQRSVYSASPRDYATWLDSKKRSAWLPFWRLGSEYLRSVLRSDISVSEKSKCWLHTMKWLKWNWPRAWTDIVTLSRVIVAGVRPQ